VTVLLNALFDHLTRHFGRIPAYGIFGFLFAAFILVPATMLGIFPREKALLEAVSDGLWMACAGMIVTLFSSEQDDA
jgi:hypothetical protein